MILAVDVGNTQTVVGLFEGERLSAHWRLHTNLYLTSDELGVKIGGLLDQHGSEWSAVKQVIVSSVVPSLTEAYERLATDMTGVDPMLVGPGLKTGMAIRYDNPHEVGADRIVNGVAAFEEHGGPVIVVDLGTATTIDVIDKDGAYLGGAIAPGLEISAEALFEKAARLSKVDLEPPEQVIGRNTIASVQSGLLFGEAAKVDGLVKGVWRELGEVAPVVATGGLAERIAPLCETVTHVSLDLTLHGLMLIYARNA